MSPNDAPAPYRKTASAALTVLIALLALIAAGSLWAAWQLGALGDWGLESGYYARFNRVEHVLESMPDVQITNSWQHQDITLEDFGFDLLIANRTTVSLAFAENSPQMKERNRERIRAFVEGEMAKAQATHPATPRTRDGPG